MLNCAVKIRGGFFFFFSRCAEKMSDELVLHHCWRSVSDFLHPPPPPRSLFLPATEGNECAAAAAVNAVDVRSGSLGGSDKEPIPGEHPSAGPRTARAHSGPGRQCHRGTAPSIKVSSAVGLERRDVAANSNLTRRTSWRKRGWGGEGERCCHVVVVLWYSSLVLDSRPRVSEAF